MKSLIFVLLVLFITVMITVLVLLYMTYAHYIYSSQPICMLHAYCDCTTDTLWRSTLRTKLTHSGTDHIRSDHIISLQLMDHVRLITTEYVCFVFYIFLVIPLIILCQMLAVIDDDISKWKPPPVTSLELFIRQNEMDLLSHGIPPNKFHNLSKGEKLAIKTLSINKNIMIKPADKGQDVVQDVLDYINEGIRQLSDTNFYIETQEYLKKHTLDINAFPKTMSESKEIDDKCYEYLYVSKERTSLFYMLPEIHRKTKNPPGRPIVSGNGCPTERISQFSFSNQLSNYFLYMCRTPHIS